MRALKVPLILLLPLLSPGLAHACAVCFGTDNKKVISAFTWGAGLLILTVFSILAVVVRYILRTERAKAEQYRREGLMEEGEEHPGRFS